MKRLVIFDLDGTLLNTIDDLATSVNHALCRHSFPQHELPEYRYFVGNGVAKLIERALPPEARQPETIETLRQEFIAYYQQHKTVLTRPYEGIPALLDTLADKGLTLAVASNKYHQGTEELVAHYFGNTRFAAVLGQRAGIPVKPDPAIVLDILQRTQTVAEETLYVGDSGVDMQTAQRAGVRSVGVTWGFRPRQELVDNGACHLADRPDEILRYL